MKNIEKNLDIIYEKHKNKIVVNIYSDIAKNEIIHHIDDINNNDTLNFISNIFSSLEFLIINLYNYMIYSFPSILLKLYKIQYIILISALFFSFVGAIENNSYISTNLIISAYFQKTSKIVFFKKNSKKCQENQKFTKPCKKRRN